MPVEARDTTPGKRDLEDMFDPCLCFLFNHPFPQVIPHLEALYRPRFSKIKFLMPFVRLPECPDVINVYRGSFCHQGYVTDALHDLVSVECSHYIFMQDDVMLNPRLTAPDLASKLGLEQSTGFVGRLLPINADVGSWQWLPGILWKLLYPRNPASGTGVESLSAITQALPPIDVARRAFAEYGIRDLPVLFRSADVTPSKLAIGRRGYFGARQSPEFNLDFSEKITAGLFDSGKVAGDKIELPYPLARTNQSADFYVVPKDALLDFAHYAGILAAIGLFAEIAVGSAMVLSIKKIKQCKDTGTLLDWRANEERGFYSDVTRLLKAFENERLIATHPVKLGALSKDQHFMKCLLEATSK
jgi:hypothetical protein